MTRRNYHSQKKVIQYVNIRKKSIGFKKNTNNHGFFHYNIRADPMFGIGYVDVRQIPCICSTNLSKLASP